MSATDLSMHLLRQREVLELMLFKLEELEMLLSTGRTRWVHHATVEVDRVAKALTSATIERDALFFDVAAEWGAPEATALRELIDVAPTDAWREVLGSHHEALSALAAEIAEKKGSVNQHLRTALRVTQETIAGLGEPTGEYAASGSRVADAGSRLLDVRV
ncbi:MULTISPECIES: flagellar export chaperone FlgN [Microbacterium]|uniref:flagellar export chaperone FlgN n=1 Tax=Microbacterium TaxID=33882 RepID=UPI00094211C8|nr:MULTISPECIES: flagellar export chaperone FlgN [Microbacterium]